MLGRQTFLFSGYGLFSEANSLREGTGKGGQPKQKSPSKTKLNFESYSLPPRYPATLSLPEWTPPSKISPYMALFELSAPSCPLDTVICRQERNNAQIGMTSSFKGWKFIINLSIFFEKILGGFINKWHYLMGNSVTLFFFHPFKWMIITLLDLHSNWFIGGIGVWSLEIPMKKHYITHFGPDVKKQLATYVPGSSPSRFVGDGKPPTFNRESLFHGYINPYYWVDEFIPYYMEIMGV